MSRSRRARATSWGGAAAARAGRWGTKGTASGTCWGFRGGRTYMGVRGGGGPTIGGRGAGGVGGWGAAHQYKRHVRGAPRGGRVARRGAPQRRLGRRLG